MAIRDVLEWWEDSRFDLSQPNNSTREIRLDPDTYRIGRNATITRPLDLPAGAILKPAAGVTLTITGPIKAGLYQIFDLSAGGTVSFLGNKKMRHLYSQWWGAVYDGVTDDTPAHMKAIAAGEASNIRSVRITSGPLGTVITGELTIPTAFAFKGTSRTRSILVHRPLADGTCVKVSAGVATSFYNEVGNFSIFSDNLTNSKVGVEVSDTSSLSLYKIRVYGTGVGTPSASYYSGGANGSIGIRFRGREATGLDTLNLECDRPIVISRNPNTAATDGEDVDHFTGRNFYLSAKGYHHIYVEDGIGISNLSLTGYQAWVGGIGGLRINDTRVAPVVRTRLLHVANLRGEQCQDPNGYWFDISAAQAIETFMLSNCLGDSTAQGIKLVNVLQTILTGVEMATAAGKDSLNVSGATGGSAIILSGCLWQPGSVFTTTGYVATRIDHWNTTLSAGPQTATLVNTGIGDTLVNVGKVTATAAPATTGLLVQASGGGDAMQVQPQAAGTGVSDRAVNGAQSDFVPRSWTAASYTWRYRTGVGTSATGMQMDTSGQVSVAKRFFLGSDAGALQSGCGVFAGTGAPNNANGSNNDFYFRGDGGVGTTIYKKAAGAWAGIL